MLQPPRIASPRLTSTWHARVVASGLGIDPACSERLEQLVSLGAVVLDSTGATPEVLNQAAANLERLVDTMADIARSQGDQVLHEWWLQGALSRLCPLFPFC
jgi:hypothetical protein